jgi:NAD(P)H-dependent flavin oxidoreductase YrpB (nitropropane dioxygenase family)
MQVMISVQEGVMDYAGLRGEGDPDRDFMPAGQGLGLIRDIKPAAEVMQDIIREAETVLSSGVFARNGR